MASYYCEHCDKLIDLDSDVEHQEQCEQEHKESEERMLNQLRYFRNMPVEQLRYIHLAIAEWLFNNRHLEITEVYQRINAIEIEARNQLKKQGYK